MQTCLRQAQLRSSKNEQLDQVAEWQEIGEAVGDEKWAGPTDPLTGRSSDHWAGRNSPEPYEIPLQTQ